MITDVGACTQHSNGYTPPAPFISSSKVTDVHTAHALHSSTSHEWSGVIYYRPVVCINNSNAYLYNQRRHAQPVQRLHSMNERHSSHLHIVYARGLQFDARAFMGKFQRGKAYKYLQLAGRYTGEERWQKLQSLEC